MPALLLRPRLLFRLCAALLPAVPGAAQSPPDLPLKENDVTRVECHWDRDEKLQGFDPDHGPQKGVWHYDVFLPKGYLSEKARRYPCLFLSSPGGEAKNLLPPYREWLAQNGWLAVMLVESRNGPFEPSLGNFLSAHDDAVRRLRILDTMKVAAGMSGAARISSLFVQIRPGFRGLFLQGAGFGLSTGNNYWMQHLPPEGSLSIFLTMGKKDPNTVEIPLLRDSLPPGIPWLPRMFDGGHTPPPPAIATEGMDWLAHRMWLSAAADKSVRAQAPAHVKLLAARSAEATTPAARYALLQEIADVVKACQLASHPDIVPLMNGFSAQFAELKKDPAILSETKAAGVLASMVERRKQTALKASKLKDAEAKKVLWQEFSATCEAAATPYKGTKSGNECLRLAEGLNPP
jgi:hypothetical protein